MMREENFKKDQGFTLIEMIGVLAVVGVLAALILPRVFDVIASSKIDALAAACKTYEAAITNYYADIGTILPLNASGIPQTESSGDSGTVRSLPARLTLSSYDSLVTGSNLWPKFKGPYLEKFNSNNAPGLGANIYLPAETALAYDANVTGNNLAWDLKGDDGRSDLPSGASVVYLRLTGLSEDTFLEFDSIVDSDIGTNDAQKERRGRAKWHAADGGTLYLYMAHR